MLMSYAKRSLRVTIGYGSSTLFSRAISFFLLPYFLSKLTLFELGIWDWYQTWFSLGTFLLSSGVATAMTRFVLLNKNNVERQKEAIGNALIFSLIAIKVFLLVGYILFLGGIVTIENKFFCITLINVAFSGFFSVVSSYFCMREEIVLYALVFSSQSLLAIFLTLIGVAYNYRIESFFYANLISLIPFLVGFLFLLKSNFCWNYSLFKDQVKFAAPIVLNGLLYILLLNVDRWMLQLDQGYEALGGYGLLNRFGGIFQILTLAVANTWPIMCFNAQKEPKGNFLVSKIITYFSLILMSGCLLTLTGSSIIIASFLPAKYCYFIKYLPAFFMPILLLSLAQLFTVGCGLSSKSTFLPLVTTIILIFQFLFLYYLKCYGIMGICLANSLAFLIYIIFNWRLSLSVYESVINFHQLSRAIAVFCIYMIAFQLIFLNNFSSWFLIILMALWPLLLIYIGLLNEEWNFCSNKIKHAIIYFFVKILKKRNFSRKDPLHTVVCLRTDICTDEITIGGAAAQTLGMLKGWQENEFKIICASSAMPSVLSKIDYIEFRQLRVWPFFCFLRWKFAYLRWQLECVFSNVFFFIQLVYLKKHAIGLVYHCYSIFSCLGILLSRFLKVPLILEYNGSEVWTFKIGNEHHYFRLDWLGEIIEHINLSVADCVVVVSEHLKKEVVEKGAEESKVLVKQNGVDVNFYNPSMLKSSRTRIRSELNLHGRYVLGYIGSFGHWHGTAIFAEIIPQVIKFAPSAHFLLIGDGSLRKSLEDELKNLDISSEHVTFVGQIAQEQAREYLAACDAFLCPAQPYINGVRNFCSYIKLIEYLSMEKPIIALSLEQIVEMVAPSIRISDIHDNSSALRNESYAGIIVDEKHAVEEFCYAIRWLLSLPLEQQQAMGKAARSRALNAYTWKLRANHMKMFIENRL